MRDGRRPYQNDFVKMMMTLVPQLAETIHGLDWFLASAPAGKAFVTCDAPVVITRPENHSPLMGVGLSTPGSLTIVPLSSRVALMLGDKAARPRVIPMTIDRDRLRWINEALMHGCERFTIGRSKALIESLLLATKIGGSSSPPRSQILGGDRSDSDRAR